MCAVTAFASSDQRRGSDLADATRHPLLRSALPPQIVMGVISTDKMAPRQSRGGSHTASVGSASLRALDSGQRLGDKSFALRRDGPRAYKAVAQLRLRISAHDHCAFFRVTDRTGEMSGPAACLCFRFGEARLIVPAQCLD